MKLINAKMLLAEDNPHRDPIGALRQIEKVIDDGDADQQDMAVDLFRKYELEIALKTEEQKNKINGWQDVFKKVARKIDAKQQSVPSAPPVAEDAEAAAQPEGVEPTLVAEPEIEQQETIEKQRKLFTCIQTTTAARDALYEKARGRDITQEEDEESRRLTREKLKAEDELNSLMEITDKYEADPLETDPLADADKMNAREKELWNDFLSINQMESLENFKRATILARQWSGLRNRLERDAEQQPEVEQQESTIQPDATPKENRSRFMETMVRAKE
ncbi:hypothetical protein HYT04_01690, partial [Candidatus Kaiserbacteria bacterium]|nr:hypothetical protein [Candidatus Kaiserbacteria bacterium]